MEKFFAKKLNNQHGVTMIEYALIAALIAVVAILALTSIGTSLTSTFTDIATKLGGAG
jgi:pilus assembly protein Flp/PilA